MDGCLSLLLPPSPASPSALPLAVPAWSGTSLAMKALPPSAQGVCMHACALRLCTHIRARALGAEDQVPSAQSRQHGDRGDSQAGVTGAACVSSQPNQVLNEQPSQPASSPFPLTTFFRSCPAWHLAVPPMPPPQIHRNPVLSSDTTLPCRFLTACLLAFCDVASPGHSGPSSLMGLPYQLCDLQHMT